MSVAVLDHLLKGVHEVAEAGDEYLQLRCEVLGVLSNQEAARRTKSVEDPLSYRGRDAGHPAPPAQIPTGGTTA